MRTLLVSLIAMCVACGPDPSDAPGDEDGSFGPEGVVETSLTLDDGTAAAGAATLTEYETTAGTDCIGGIALYMDSSGILPVEPAFLDRDVGTASRSLANVYLTWNVTDPDADGSEVTDQWSGTFELAEWTAESLVVLLRDGERCAIGDPASCVPMSGTLTFEGERSGPEPAPSKDAMYEDATTGDPICSVDALGLER